MDLLKVADPMDCQQSWWPHGQHAVQSEPLILKGTQENLPFMANRVANQSRPMHCASGLDSRLGCHLPLLVLCKLLVWAISRPFTGLYHPGADPGYRLYFVWQSQSHAPL